MLKDRCEYPYITLFSNQHTHNRQKGPARSHGPDQPVLALWTGIKAHVSNRSAAQQGTSPPFKGSVRKEMLLCTPRRADTHCQGQGNHSSVLGMTLVHQLMGSLTQKTL